MSHGPYGGPHDEWGRPPERTREMSGERYVTSNTYGRRRRGGGGGAIDDLPPRHVDSYRPYRRRWPRRLGIIVLVVVLILVVGYFYLDSRLHRLDVLTDYAGRPSAGAGTNWLLVGSDSRAGLSRSQENEFATGAAAGQRTDTMMVMHLGSGKPTMVSLPRDSYVPIPGHGQNKLNASFALGGPKLLVRTVQDVTGLRIDHYMQINFAGFVDVVDALGGVHICNHEHLVDPKAGLNLPAGCHNLTGRQALGFVRTRHFANGDLQREKDQRQFLSALMNKALSPTTALNPARSIPFALRATDAVAVARHDHLYHLAGLGMAIRKVNGGGGITTTVPVAGFGSSPAVGSYVRWDRPKALELFRALRADQPVPDSVLSR